MPPKNELQQLIINHQRRLQKLQEKQALEGLSTDPETLIEIEDIENAIAELQIKLKDLEDESGEIPADSAVDAAAENPPRSETNQIPQRQNQESFLQYLAAQRQLYDEEKKWMAIWTLTATFVAILGTGALAIFMPFTPYITLAAVLVALGEFLLLPFIVNPRKDAAKIQEFFDCELLELSWNDVLGTKPKPETILAAVERFTKQRPPEAWGKLKDWYTPKIGGLPLYRARLVCQKENIWWDSQLRREYARWVYLATALFIILFIIIGIIADWSLQQFFQGPLLLALPVFAMGLKHGYDHQKAADRLDELYEFADGLQQEASAENANPNLITRRSRELQNEIFHHRSENPPVFSWFYNKLRAKYEKLVKPSSD